MVSIPKESSFLIFNVFLFAERTKKSNFKLFGTHTTEVASFIAQSFIVITLSINSNININIIDVAIF